MKLKSILPVLASALFVSAVSFAAPTIPSQCPDAQAIQDEGISDVEKMRKNLFFGYTISEFDTDTNWYFIIGPITAKTNDEAMDGATDLLTMMSGSPSPETEEDIVYCQYDMPDEEHVAVAITVDSMGLSKIAKQFFLK
jgi:hypothetical protein